jgi:ectoine hydroxylase-related dioxygenase (phytanoyl-CoA dioxygenase family)
MVRDLNDIAGRVEPVESFGLTSSGSTPEAAVTAFQRDGVVCLRQVFSRDWLDVIEAGILQAQQGQFDSQDTFAHDGDTGRFSYQQGAWRTVEQYRQLIIQSPAADVVWPFLKPGPLIFFYENLLVKEPGSTKADTPWHQDHPYYPMDGEKIINSWIPLDPIPEETALRFLKGSHRTGQVFRTVNFADNSATYEAAPTEFPAPPDFDADPEAVVLVGPVEPGDMLIWTSRTFHSAPGNRLKHRRAAMSLNWCGGDVTYNGRPSVESYRHESFRPGMPIACDKFPIVRS